MNSSSIVIYALIAIMVGSCYPWKSKERIHAPVWSEDNSEIAYILNRYDYRRNFPDGGDVRDEQYSIFLTDREFDGHFELSNSIKGFGEELFYMKQAGYFVSGSLSDKYHMTDAETGELFRTFTPKDAEICDDKLGNFQTINVIPSIDGSRLAVLETRADCTIEIAFWEMENGQWAEGPIFDISGNDFAEVAWVDADRILVSTCEDYCSEKYYLIHATEGVNEITREDDFSAPCTFVPTSSSWINKSGEILYVDIESRDLGIGSIWDDEEFISYYEGFNEEYYQPGCDDFD